MRFEVQYASDLPNVKVTLQADAIIDIAKFLALNHLFELFSAISQIVIVIFAGHAALTLRSRLRSIIMARTVEEDGTVVQKPTTNLLVLNEVTHPLYISNVFPFGALFMVLGAFLRGGGVSASP